MKTAHAVEMKNKQKMLQYNQTREPDRKKRQKKWSMS